MSNESSVELEQVAGNGYLLTVTQDDGNTTVIALSEKQVNDLIDAVMNSELLWNRPIKSMLSAPTISLHDKSFLSDGQLRLVIGKTDE